MGLLLKLVEIYDKWGLVVVRGWKCDSVENFFAHERFDAKFEGPFFHFRNWDLPMVCTCEIFNELSVQVKKRIEGQENMKVVWDK